MPDYGELLVEPKAEIKRAESNPQKENESLDEEDVKQEEEDSSLDNIEYVTADDDPSSDDIDVSESLVPSSSIPVGRILRDRTLQVKPVKYSCFTEDPRTYKQAVSCTNSSGWSEAINNELDNIENHEVWLDHHEEPAKYLNSTFPNSTAHSPDTLLGMNLNINSDSIELSQPGLIKKGLEMLDLTDCRPVKTPLTPAIQLHSATEEDHQAFLRLHINYRSYTGMLNYLACRTRPDLASTVSILSKFNQKPGMSHWREVLHCWKYLAGTQELGLLLRPDKEKILDRLNFFTDATWAEDHESRISRSGSLVFWKSCPILWNSKKQRNITMSSTESEMSALSDGEQESQWLNFLIEELWKIKLAPTLFHIDNKGLLEKLKNFGSNSKTKHLDIKIKSLREKFKNKDIDVKLISSNDMIADSLTKAAPYSSIKKLQSKCLSVFSPTTKEGC
ncbi:hypothetical protein VP01_2704g6 [Puccinia sorghi]|uniref:Reverse transcriptase Ty1/copia-type domain-containing protein n=1 Tax=Puccinia sorghi TaxID=27349 RepID=A0A0L6V3R2_9BASI|nr:hypothetical protein VP01_2704g6 [Puccinia sorghi]